MKHDPYLIPGWPCKVWNRVNDEWYGEFYEYGKTKVPIFAVKMLDAITSYKSFKHYHPLCTEWDFAEGWELCSAVCDNGLIIMFNTIDILPQGGVWYANKFDEKLKVQFYGYCPDKSRFINGAWERSKIDRPVWAGGEGGEGWN